MLRLNNEKERNYIWRIGQLYDNNLIYLDDGFTKAQWNDLADLFNSQLREEGIEWTESTYRKRYAEGYNWYNDVFKYMFSDEYISEIDIKQRELQKERYKVQTEKMEYARWLREDAREEMFFEQIVEAIKSNDNDCVHITPIIPDKGRVEHCLCIADAHFGKDFKIYGLTNEIINEYNPAIFYSRMSTILSETIKYIEKEVITSLKVFNLGDTLDGFLRQSQIWTLRYGVVDSAVIYAKYMAEWLKQLSEYIYVEYHPTSGNHSELRMLDGKKGEHLNDNIDKIINEIIVIKNENNPNFKLIENKSGLIFTQVGGFNLLGVHGEVKSPVQAIKDFSDIYGTKIDILLTGHKHHGSFINCGYRKQIIGIGSIVGSDDFSMKLHKQADASANILAIEYGKGKINDKTILLN